MRTPTINGPTNGGVYVNGVTHALTLTVPADTTMRTLRVYLSQYQSTGALAAHLSDGSASDFSTTISASSNVYTRYTFVYRASSAAQTLLVTWTLQNDSSGNGSVDVLAATLY
jgi:hypothetical protein